jgi:hypothetical protein
MKIVKHLAVPMVICLTGCVPLHNSSSCRSFHESEVANWHKTAVEALNSSEEWNNFGLVKPPAGYKLDQANFEYILSCADPDSVEVDIDFPFSVDQPFITLRIKLDPTTGLVESMSEKVRPAQESAPTKAPKAPK